MTPAAPELADEPEMPLVLRDTPRRVRRDLRFLRLYVYTVPRTLTYASPREDAERDVAPALTVARIETGLAAESTRYRWCAWAIVVLLVSLPLLSGILWSGIYWIPVRVYWWPFERGNYGLPFFSLYEWLCYLVLAAYFAVTFALLRDGRAQTGRLGAEYRRLLAADAASCDTFVELVDEGLAPRTEFLLRKAPVFSAYRAALDGDERS